MIAVRISDSEKDHMRPRILALLPELDQQCLIHMVPAITKIFISDDPDKNAETLQVLLKPLIGASQLNCEIFRALMVFKSLVKQWRALFGFQFKAHEKIALFKQSADDIVGLVLPLWRQSVQSVLQVVYIV